MTSLQFSFEADRYSFSLHRYFRSHPSFVIQVSSLAPTDTERKSQYLTLSLPLYFSGRVSWLSSQPYIASHERLLDFVGQHPSIKKDIPELAESMRNHPFLVDMTPVEKIEFLDIWKLFVFPCDDEPVYVVAYTHSLQDQPREY